MGSVPRLLTLLFSMAAAAGMPTAQCPAGEAIPAGRSLLQLVAARGDRLEKSWQAAGTEAPDGPFQPPEPTPDSPVAKPVAPALLSSLATCVPGCATCSVATQCDMCQVGFMLVGGLCATRPATLPEVWVKATNVYRCMHGAPLVNWSVAVADNAQAYVNTLTSLVHSSSYTLPPPAGPAGENLAMGYGSQEASVAGWYSEVSCCQSFPGCTTGPCTTGHFTALVWAGVSEIGCASNSLRIDICRYRSGDTLSSRTANMQGYYPQNVLAASKDAQTCIAQIEAASGGTTGTTGRPGTTAASATTLTSTSTQTTTPAPQTTTLATSTRSSPPGLSVASGPCTIDAGGCALSPNYPLAYGNSQACSISVGGSFPVTALSFSTELNFDKLLLNNAVYSGTVGPQGVVTSGPITWSSDSSVVGTGWRLCPGMPPSTVSTTTTPPPSCPAAAAGSRGTCETCLTGSQCQSGMFCCPYMKKCVPSSTYGCGGAVAICTPTCPDSSCQSSTGICSCSSCTNVGPGKRYPWTVWATLANSTTSTPRVTCPAALATTTAAATTSSVAPAPSPTTAPAQTTTVSSGSSSAWQVASGLCSIDASGCATSPGYPTQYGNSQACSITVTSAFTVGATSFSTEPRYDTLRINSVDYSGTAGPQGVVASGTITWTSDSTVTAAGWRLCPVTTTTGGPLPLCTRPAAGSRGQCESCLTGADCQSGQFCCPYMKKCVASGSTPCSFPIASCSPSCFDSSCSGTSGCSCTGCSTAGLGKQYDWLVWANLRNSNSAPVVTCRVA